ncbi:hypothetical protein HanIR_Chr12g0561421 [Helianthus annuus]|nr:hypothetical protein HanIR_Chr12g0561421 [Helianthus annuus]
MEGGWCYYYGNSQKKKKRVDVNWEKGNLGIWYRWKMGSLEWRLVVFWVLVLTTC